LDYDLAEMIKVLEKNKENIEKETGEYKCSDFIYKILLETGQYINAKDIIYQIIKILFLIEII